MGNQVFTGEKQGERKAKQCDFLCCLPSTISPAQFPFSALNLRAQRRCFFFYKRDVHSLALVNIANIYVLYRHALFRILTYFLHTFLLFFSHVLDESNQHREISLLYL